MCILQFLCVLPIYFIAINFLLLPRRRTITTAQGLEAVAKTHRIPPELLRDVYMVHDNFAFLSLQRQFVFLIQAELTYKIILVSGVQRSDATILYIIQCSPH